MNAPMIKPNLSTCRTCAASHRDQHGRFCRLNPPVTQFVAIAEGGAVTVQQVTNFPKVEDGWSCYQHKAVKVFDEIGAAR